MYEDCARDYYKVKRPMNYEIPLQREDGSWINDSPGCRYDANPIPYNGIGYIEGMNVFYLIKHMGEEIAYDFTTMTSARFNYLGWGLNDSLLGTGYGQYAGIVGFPPFPGFNSQKAIITDYEGPVVSVNVGASSEIGIGISSGIIGFISPTLNPIGGLAWYVGGSISADPIFGFDVGGAILNYLGERGSLESYTYTDRSGYSRVDIGKLSSAIRSGNNSPWLFTVPVHGQASRLYALTKIIEWSNIYEILNKAGK
jgi:hypothetical protein